VFASSVLARSNDRCAHASSLGIPNDMTADDIPIAFLRPLLSHTTEQKAPLHWLPTQEVVVIGRDSHCQIVVDPVLYGAVSRRHAEIRPAATPTPQSQPTWWVCDLNSSNGTYVNGVRLQGCQILQAGDRIVLGHNGPAFRFDYHPATQLSSATVTPLSVRSAGATNRDAVTLTQLFPIFSTGQDFSQKAYLGPGVVTVLFVVCLFLAVGHPIWFNFTLASYIALAAYYFIYRICGKRKPWWVLLGAGLITVGILRSPLLPLFIVFFRQVLPGEVPQPDQPISFALLLVRMFFGAGLMEELLKALPIFVFYWLGQTLRSPWREKLGVQEPLDGILLGTAAAVGFTLLETLGQYVPGVTQNATLQAGAVLSQEMGFQLLIPRVLGAIAGHMAYSGYLGYFIGLSILKPENSWLTLSIGYLTAASLHALWNAAGSLSPILLALVGIISYAFLVAAIVKARALSPLRSQNFATRLKR
jgi:RsiW-degrading membrane proteinase PrsW (M82 family)